MTIFRSIVYRLVSGSVVIMMLLKFSVVLVLCFFCNAAKFPNFIKRCNYGDVECIVEVTNDVLENHVAELTSYGLPVFDPWYIDNVTAREGIDGPISLNLHLTDCFIRGFSNLRFYKAVGWNKDILNSKFELHGRNSLLDFSGKYNVEGRIMSLPIQGNGTYNMIMGDISWGFKLKPDVYTKNGKKHLKIKQFKLLLDPAKFHIHLTNLFDGNEELGQALLDVVNDNWRDAWDELEPSLFPISEQIIKTIMQSFFDMFPYENMFLPEEN